MKHKKLLTALLPFSAIVTITSCTKPKSTQYIELFWNTDCYSTNELSLQANTVYKFKLKLDGEHNCIYFTNSASGLTENAFSTTKEDHKMTYYASETSEAINTSFTIGDLHGEWMMSIDDGQVAKSAVCGIIVLELKTKSDLASNNVNSWTGKLLGKPN